MRCSTCQDKLSDYIDNLLPATERRQMDEHLTDCSLCHTLHQDLAMICEASRELPECSPSDVVWERIREKIDRAWSEFLALLRADGGAGWAPWIVTGRIIRCGALMAGRGSPTGRSAPIAERRFQCGLFSHLARAITK